MPHSDALLPTSKKDPKMTRHSLSHLAFLPWNVSEEYKQISAHNIMYREVVSNVTWEKQASEHICDPIFTQHTGDLFT